MERVILYGIGEYYKNHKHLLPKDMEVIAFGDSAEEKATSHTGRFMDGRPILSPAEIEKEAFDSLYICPDFHAGNRIYHYLQQFDIPVGKIRFLNRINTVKEGWEYAIQEDKSIVSSIGQIKIRERMLADFDNVAEVFAENCYNVDITEKGTIVIDMGMNIGAATLFFAGNDLVEKVYSFEPFPDTYQQAIDNFALNTDKIRDKIHPFHLAVLDWEGDKEVSVDTEQTGWRNIFSHNESKQMVTIHCRQAKDVVKEIVEENPGKKVILKVDTEGSEFAIFDSLGQTELLNQIDTIVMEYHNDPEPIISLLKKYHFRYSMNGNLNIGTICAFHMDGK